MEFDYERGENIVGKRENVGVQHFPFFPQFFQKKIILRVVNPLPDMPILGSSNSAACKDIMSKIWTNGDTII